MEKTEIAQRVQQIVSGILKHSNFEMKDELTARDVEGWDSLSHMAIITDMEERFGIKFKLRELNKLSNMGTLIELIRSKLV
jgi:acyl carrier protein